MPESTTVTTPEAQRVDRWLWAARFFKTRGLAQQAVRGGKVDLNGSRCKPARPVRVGDRLRISKGEEVFEVEILALAERRGPAAEARTLYRESEESRGRREDHREQRRLSAEPSPGRRPDKRERRRLRELKR